MLILNNKLPQEFQSTCDQIVKEFYSGNTNPDELSSIYKWLEDEYWLIVEDDLGFEEAIYTLGLSSELNENDFEASELTESFKIQQAREALYDPFITFAFLLYEIQSNTNQSVILVIHGSHWGQGGWECGLFGLYESKDAFIQEINEEGRFWLTYITGEITDEKILSLWN
jgi:hypothetical protein